MEPANSYFAEGARLGFTIMLAALALAGCADPAASTEEGGNMKVKYLVGPDPMDFQGVDHRFRIELPTDYLPPSFASEFSTGSTVSGVVFAASLRDFGPAGDARVEKGGVFSGRISWAPDDYVRKRVDGSWLNHFSQYSVPVGEKFGLEVRETTSAAIDSAKLYVSPSSDEDTFIECNYFPSHDRPQLCGMQTKRPGKPLLAITILQDNLSQWKNIRDGANRLVDEWTAAAENGDR